MPSDRKEYNRQYFLDNKSKNYEICRRYREKIKAEMVEAYGGECQYCGESDPIVLVIDHIYDDRQTDPLYKDGGVHFYLKLKNLNWPKDRYQLLCCNCNYRKEYLRRKRNAVEKLEAR